MSVCLQYNRARYFSPAGARFISQDPAGFEGSGSNLYWYANADPLDFTDPSGEYFKIGDWPSDAPSVGSLPIFIEATEGRPTAFPNWLAPQLPPAPGWEWYPLGETPGTGKGSWWNPETEEQLRPDLESEEHGPHYDYKRRRERGKGYRVYPDGRIEKK